MLFVPFLLRAYVVKVIIIFYSSVELNSVGW